MILKLTKPLQKIKFLDLIYKGQIICFEEFDEIKNIIGAARSFIENLTDPYQPEGLHKNILNKKSIEIILEFQKDFRNSRYVYSQLQ